MRKKLTTEQFIEKAKKIHGNKYDYSKVNYINNNTDICIICPKHGKFRQKPKGHLEGKGCKECAKEILSEKRKMDTEEFIKRAKKIHGDKFDYSKTDLKNRNEKGEICIICPIHGEFWQNPTSHLCGKGCKKCKGLEKTTEEFIEQAKKIHGDKFDYSKVNYIDSKHKVIIICTKHGEFKQKPGHHLNGQGCPFCRAESVGKRMSLVLDTFIEKANKKHFGKYNYSKVDLEHRDEKGRVCIICPIHGEFWQKPSKHLFGEGCPICNESKLEERTRVLLTELGITFESQKKFDWLGRKSLDFYLPKYNVAIECQGKQHFIGEDFFGGKNGFIERKKRDKEKASLCETNGINLLYYNYNEKIETLEHKLEKVLRQSTRD